jgi:hypothetical protein
LFIAAAGLMAPSLALAQLNGPNIKGDAGLKSGSQPPPGAYLAVPLYFYDGDTVRNRNGDELASGDLAAFVGGVALNVVTKTTIGGANYGVLVVLPFANNRVQGARIDDNPGGGLTDMYIQPLNLGWHRKRVDTVAGYGLVIPIGRYEDGASDNTGLGMWTHELFGGTTVFFDDTRTWHASVLASLDFNSKKKDSETKAGNILNLEGGVGRDLLKGAGSVGLAYYATYKLAHDRFSAFDLNNEPVRGKNRVYGLGPEFTLPIATKKALFGFVTVRYQWEVGARTTTQGSAWNIMTTILLKPLALQQP